MLQVDELLPDFDLENQDGTTVNQQTLLGSYAVLYFYPKDDTPGCTVEACDFTDNIGYFNKLKVPVYGISLDSVASHRKFIEKKSLKVHLLADEKAVFSTQCGVYGEKKLYGRTYMGITRTTFIVDNQLKVVKVYPKVKVKDHVETVMKDLEQLISK